MQGREGECPNEKRPRALLAAFFVFNSPSLLPALPYSTTRRTVAAPARTAYTPGARRAVLMAAAPVAVAVVVAT